MKLTKSNYTSSTGKNLIEVHLWDGEDIIDGFSFETEKEFNAFMLGFKLARRAASRMVQNIPDSVVSR